jgi:hypothetical protein
MGEPPRHGIDPGDRLAFVAQRERDDLRNNVANYEALLKQTLTQDPGPLADPPTNQETLQDGAVPVLVSSFNDAWRLYVKTVAMSLVVETSGYVPWSIASYDARSLTALFDSRNLLSYTWSGCPANLGVPTPAAARRRSHCRLRRGCLPPSYSR